MSTYYYIDCSTCGATSENLGNHVKDEVIALAAEWPAIKAALELFSRLTNIDISLDLQRPNGYAFTNFMRDHADHQLLLSTEYDSDTPEPLVVGGAPSVIYGNVETALPDGMWVFVKDGKIIASNFEPRPPGYCDEAAAVVSNADACGRCASCVR